MSSQTLKTYLSSRPTSVPSAAELARTHGVDTKTATRILKSYHYVAPQTWGEGWTYVPPNAPKPEQDPVLLLTMALSNNYLLAIPPVADLEAFVPTEYFPRPEDTDEPFPLDSKEHYVNTMLALLDADDSNALRMLLISLTRIVQGGILPIRGQISARGITPLTLTPKADTQ